MTKLLARAFDLASKLPDELQDQLATELLTELADEERWDNALAESSSEIERLADEALEEYRRGRTLEQGIDDL